jgi:hypothetical protein
LLIVVLWVDVMVVTDDVFVNVVAGVMQGINSGEGRLEKRYSPSFREDSTTRPHKRKRDDIFR